MLLFHERFIEHKSKQFVDLCSVSNVSVDTHLVHYVRRWSESTHLSTRILFHTLHLLTRYICTYVHIM